VPRETPALIIGKRRGESRIKKGEKVNTVREARALSECTSIIVSRAMQTQGRGGASFIEYEPSGVPGFDSTIRETFPGLDIENVELFLGEAIKMLEQEGRIDVERIPLHDGATGSHGKTIPAKFRVIVRPA
jgi:hypothetical protein